jgi:ribonuclease E
MTRILKLPFILPLRVAALQLRLARGAAELALGLTRDLAGGTPWDRDSDAAPAEAAPRGPVPRPTAPAAPRATGPDPADTPRQAPRRAAVQRTRAGRRAPAAMTATEVPSAPEEAPRPRPRRAARKATAGKPARKRATGPTRGEAAAIREAQRKTEAAAPVTSAGPATGAGPEIHVEAPWEGYDAMPLHEVLARLEGADEALVAAVRLYEQTRESRQAILLATETA